MPAAVVVKVDMKRSRDGSMMVFEVSYAAERGSNRAGKWLIVGSVCHLLAFDAILLSNECEGDVRGGG